MTGIFRASSCSACVPEAFLRFEGGESEACADIFLDRLFRAHGAALTGAMKASARARCHQLCAADLDDIVSESLLKLLDILRRGRSVSNVLAMARCIAANMATDRRRWMARAGRLQRDWKVHLDISGATETVRDDAPDLFGLMGEALRELSEEERALVTDMAGGLGPRDRKRRSRSLAKARGIAKQKLNDALCL